MDQVRTQGLYWMVTLSKCQGDLAGWSPEQWFLDNDNVRWVKGQQEIGGIGGYHHYQFVVALKKKLRQSGFRKLFVGCDPHVELTKSKAADEYVHKEETKVPGSEFELGGPTF